jgi:hypothetical protein
VVQGSNEERQTHDRHILVCVSEGRTYGHSNGRQSLYEAHAEL